ncbi:MAG: hypothetical protein WBG48_05750 [Pricia sp.]
MKTEYKDVPLVKNEDKKRFEIEVDGHYAFIDYKEPGNDIALVHTKTDSEKDDDKNEKSELPTVPFDSINRGLDRRLLLCAAGREFL